MNNIEIEQLKSVMPPFPRHITINEPIKIVDDFLPEESFFNLQQMMFSPEFHWGYTEGIVNRSEDDFQFVHLFYIPELGGQPCSDHWNLLETTIRKIDELDLKSIVSLYRIKANLRVRTPNIEEHTPYHADMEHLKGVDEHWTTSILYMNTNDGYTKFEEDGSKVESVANRLVTFPAKMKHLGTSCTNTKSRVVINFNYLKPPT